MAIAAATSRRNIPTSKVCGRSLPTRNILIYLKCSFENSTSRRKLNWLPADHEEQLRRLSHALEHADLIIDTDTQNADDVLAQALDYLKEHIS